MDLLHAINWVHDLWLINMEFELDAKIVVDYFNNGKYNIIERGLYIRWM